MADDLGGMRVLMFARTMAMGGTERVVLQLCRALKGEVGFLGVMSRGGELAAELGAMGVQHFKVPDITGKDPATFAKVSRELRCVVRENGVNLVHCHHRMAALYCRLALPKGVRAVATAHNVFSGGARRHALPLQGDARCRVRRQGPREPCRLLRPARGPCDPDTE